MSLRSKRALIALLRGLVVLAGLVSIDMLRNGEHFAFTPLIGVFIVFEALLVGYTWWWYGPSPKAVAMRAKGNAKRAERGLPPLG